MKSFHFQNIAILMCHMISLAVCALVSLFLVGGRGGECEVEKATLIMVETTSMGLSRLSQTLIYMAVPSFLNMRQFIGWNTQLNKKRHLRWMGWMAEVKSLQKMINTKPSQSILHSWQKHLGIFPLWDMHIFIKGKCLLFSL